MAEAYIVAAVRTAGGRRGGKLAGWHPVDLAAQVIDALLDRSGADPALVEDVIWAASVRSASSPPTWHATRCWPRACPSRCPAPSLDRQCGSSQQALHFAAQAVMSGTQDIVIAAGVESMTRVPMFTPSALPQKNGMGFYMSPQIRKRYGDTEFSQFTGPR
jgi:acetyl-CoA C-acetyltransferase